MFPVFKDITSKDEHQLRLARLQWELKQRKNLSEYCLELQEVGRRVSTSLNETKDKLNNLAPQLRDLLAAAEPLQKSLGLPSSGLSHLSNSKINLLPAPLFLLHAQTTAYAEAFSNDLIHVCEYLTSTEVGFSLTEL